MPSRLVVAVLFLLLLKLIEQVIDGLRRVLLNSRIVRKSIDFRELQPVFSQSQIKAEILLTFSQLGRYPSIFTPVSGWQRHGLISLASIIFAS